VDKNKDDKNLMVEALMTSPPVPLSTLVERGR